MTAKKSNFWSRQFRQWHWISSALVLALMLLFSVTGLTLNHPDWFQSEPVSEMTEVDLSVDLQEALSVAESDVSLPADVAAKLNAELGTDINSAHLPTVEYDELMLDLSGPGVDANLTIDLAGGVAYFERIDNGVIAKLNDLHKGRDTGLVWGALIDITAIICVIFCLSGLGLLFINARARKATWPITTAGIFLPFLAYVLFVHV